MRFTRLLATGATAAVLGSTAIAAGPVQAASPSGVAAQGDSLRLQSTPNKLRQVRASGGVKKSTVQWYWDYQPDPRTTGYRVQARRNKGRYRTVRTVGADAGSTVVRNLRKGNYRFRVRALSGSAAGAARVAVNTVRVRSRKLPKRFYTFRSKKDPLDYMTLRVMSDRTVHGIAWRDAPSGYNDLVGRLYRKRIKGKTHFYESFNWRQATTGRWNTLHLKGHTRVKKSKALSGHKSGRLFRREMRLGVIPRN